MAGAPIVGSKRTRTGQVFTVTWWENKRRLQQEFATRSAARAFRDQIAARQRAEKR